MLYRAATLSPAMLVPSLLWLVGAVAEARPLDVEACGKLKGELTALDEKGVKTLIDKGPVAAKDAASKDQLRQVRQYFDLLGNFRFRCPQDAPLVVLKPEPVDDPAEAAAAATAPIDAGTPGITLPAGVAAATVGAVAASPPRKPAVPKAAAAAAVPAAPPVKKPPAASKAAAPVAPGSPQVAPQAPVAPAAVKPKPKPKSDDAFRPQAVPAAPVAPTQGLPAKAP